MEIRVESWEIIKTGTNKSGDWEFIIVKASNGNDYATFDRKCKVDKGTTLEIGEPIVKDGKLSFKECTVPEIPPISWSHGEDTSKTEKPPTGKKDFKRDIAGIEFEYNLKAILQARQNASIESQVAFKGFIDLAVKGDIDIHKAPFNDALKWGVNRLKGNIIPPDKPNLSSEAPKSTPLKDSGGSVAERYAKDPSHLLEDLKTVKWYEATIMSYLKNLWEVDDSGSVLDVVARLGGKQREMLFAEIEERKGTIKED